MAILLHGTTELRAASILAAGPDPEFVEPLGGSRAEAFSTCLKDGPFPLGRPEEYACRKKDAFPDEGDAVIIEVDVPDAIIAFAVDETYFPLSQGIVQFDSGYGLDELRMAWPNLPRRIIKVDCR